MGNDMMSNTLIFMAYADSTGKNVTLSPRLSNGNVEPEYTKDVSGEVLPGSGIVNGTIKVNAKCGNCRKWKGASIDPASSSATFIFASGRGGSVNSNSPSAGVKRHFTYGSFTMDLTKAVGPANVPDHFKASTDGSFETSNEYDKKDFSGAAHAVLMVLTFVGLLPLGVLILRVFKSPKWHGVAQGLSLAMALAGMVIGIMMGMKYNRVSLMDFLTSQNAADRSRLDQRLQYSPSNHRIDRNWWTHWTICSWIPPSQSIYQDSRTH